MRCVPLAVLALLTACSPSASENESQAKGAPADGPAATLILAAGTACTAQWDGQSLSPKALGDRAFELLSKRIDAAGGPAAITLETLPYLRIEAPPETAWPCAGEALSSLQHAGYGQAALRPTGLGNAPDQLVQLPHGTVAAPLPGRLVTVGAGGAIDANGKPLDRPALRDFARANSSGGPDDFSIAPLPGARFNDVYQTLNDLRAGGAGVMLAAPAGPAATADAPPVPAVPQP